ncbi:hypothetical protein NUM3379_23150 [Kineococcus sp. NUM-3379]
MAPEQAADTSGGARTSDSRWRALLAHAADVTWTAEADATITWATWSLEGQLGWGLDEVTGRCAFDFVHPEDRPAFREAWQRLTSGTGQQVVLECRIARADGTWRWVRETLTDLRPDPSVGAVVGNVVDITDRRLEQRARERQESRTRAVFEQSHVPQATVDAAGRLSAVNAALCDLLGRRREELLGRAVTDLHHPDSPVVPGRSVADVLTGRQAVQVERLLLRPDGPPVPVLVDVTPLHDADGTPDGAVSIFHDLTALRDSERRRAEQEHLHGVLSARTSDLALVADPEGRIRYASSAAQHLFGYAVEDLLGRVGWELVHPDDVDAAKETYAQVVAGGGTRTMQLRVRAADGRWRWVEDTVSDLLGTSVGGLVCNLRDVTERVEAEQALRASEARYRTLVDTAEEGIWAVGTTGRTLYANARLADLLGLPLEEVYRRSVRELLEPAADADAAGLLHRAAHATERYEVRYRPPGGGERFFRVAAAPLPGADGTVEGSMALVSDVTETRRVEEVLRHAALHDALTGLPNRTLLTERLRHALAGPGRTGVVFLDLDDFKQVNDSRGHGTGDRLLLAVAERFAAVTGPRDTVGRFGGDEFLVVCEDTDEERAAAAARSLLDALAEPFEVAGEHLHVAASVGVAVSPPASAEDLLRYADIAMYAAKDEGRARVRLFDAALGEDVEQRYALAADLRAALAADELAVHLQPVLDLRSGQVVGVEALARWEHPVLGWVPPSRFVAVAEAHGLASELDRWALRRALREVARLLAQGALPAGAYVAVNLSARNLADPALEQAVVAEAAAAGLPAGQVVLEITESCLMEDAEEAADLLRRLRARGFGVAVDDFGTGYSSLAYLRDLPVTALKIDRSFVADIATSRDALSIVASILDLARAVDAAVIAEGVETRRQADLLQELGCPYGQGWLWSPALPPARVGGAWSWTRAAELPRGPGAGAAAGHRPGAALTGTAFPDFVTAAQEVLPLLRSRTGLRLWTLMRTAGDEQVVLAADDTPDSGYDVPPGTVLSWAGSLCTRMVEGLGPAIAPRVADAEAYALAPNRRELHVEAYVGLPLRERDGTLFGTLCGFDPAPQPEALRESEEFLVLQARLLATVLDLELDRDRQRRRAQRAEEDAARDPLTGLANRRAWDAAFEAEEARCRRYGHPAAVVVVDVNGLKEANDTRGHEAGDLLLRRCAEVLLAGSRETDLVARLGGDEFGVLVVETDRAGALARVCRTREALVSAGVGAAVGLGVRGGAGSLQAAWREADEAMYADKRAAAGRTGRPARGAGAAPGPVDPAR